MNNIPRDHFLHTARKPLVFAHRGVSAEAPENTMAAFYKAREYDIPGIELDIHRCASGEAVIIHDFSTKRVAGKQHKISRTPYSLLSNLDAGGWFSDAYKGEKIPLLEELFATFGDTFYYDLEIKEASIFNRDFAGTVITLINKYNLEHRCLISSFNPFVLKAVRTIDKKIPTALIYGDTKQVPFFLRDGASNILIHADILKPNIKAFEHHTPDFWENKTVLTWTVNTENDTKKALDRGALGIISNNPHHFAHLWR